jgi:hypothetical protein
MVCPKSVGPVASTRTITCSTPIVFVPAKRRMAMNYLDPLAVAAQISQWIDQLEKTRSGSYEGGIEELEGILRQWKGTDKKVVPLSPPEDVRYNVEYVEALLKLVHLLKDDD